MSNATLNPEINISKDFYLDKIDFGKIFHHGFKSGLHSLERIYYKVIYENVDYPFREVSKLQANGCFSIFGVIYLSTSLDRDILKEDSERILKPSSKEESTFHINFENVFLEDDSAKVKLLIENKEEFSNYATRGTVLLVLGKFLPNGTFSVHKLAFPEVSKPSFSPTPGRSHKFIVVNLEQIATGKQEINLLSLNLLRDALLCNIKDVNFVYFYLNLAALKINENTEETQINLQSEIFELIRYIAIYTNVFVSSTAEHDALSMLPFQPMPIMALPNSAKILSNLFRLTSPAILTVDQNYKILFLPDKIVATLAVYFPNLSVLDIVNNMLTSRQIIPCDASIIPIYPSTERDLFYLRDEDIPNLVVVQASLYTLKETTMTLENGTKVCVVTNFFDYGKFFFFDIGRNNCQHFAVNFLGI